MCGITGCVNRRSDISINNLDIIVWALNILQNRGNDSYGIGCREFMPDDGTSKISLFKRANVDKQYFEDIMESDLNYIRDNAALYYPMIGHCRWATHGRTSCANAHPHFDWTRNFALVHNGTIENYDECRQFLSNKGIDSVSQTDTEVIVNLISYYYHDVNGAGTGADIQNAIRDAIQHLKGTWACALISNYHPDDIIVFCNTCPLLVGWSDSLISVASEASAFTDHIEKYGRLKDGIILILGKKWEIDIEQFEYIRDHSSDGGLTSPAPYKHWMLREINDQSKFSANLLQRYMRKYDTGIRIDIPELESVADNLIGARHLLLVGCGTSYYAGCYARSFFCGLNHYETVQCIDASDFDLSYLPLDLDLCQDQPTVRSHVCCFLLSQSGETMDLIRVQKILKGRHITDIAVCNVPYSSITTSAEATILTSAGREVAVASTKSYTNQIIVLKLVSIWLTQTLRSQTGVKLETSAPQIEANTKAGTELEDLDSIMGDIVNLSSQINEVIENETKTIQEWSRVLKDCQRVFILGKKFGYNIAKEASLKLKEIGYLHAEAYSSGALKHGPYSLIEEGRPIIFIAGSDDDLHVTINEVRSRGALVYVVTDDPASYSNSDAIIQIPHNRALPGILQIIPFQLLSYYIAIEKGHNPDFPRNLAKSVTVD